MVKFLTKDEIYRLLQRELPEGVYADGAPSAFYTTADMDSIAKVAATAYGNLERVYENIFPTMANELIEEWEKTTYGQIAASGLSIAERDDRVVNKLRQQPDLTLWRILTLVAGLIPEGTYVEIIEWAKGRTEGWIIGVSELGYNTALADALLTPAVTGSLNRADVCDFLATENGWRLGVSELGVTTQFPEFDYDTVTAYQMRAYAYDIRIYEYTLSPSEYALINREVTKAEPARSTHFIFDNQSLAGNGLITPVDDVDQFSLINCITRDSGSDTGYSGLT